ncbi:hypothetical protein [Coleofasciculus sp. E1-EBD-02]|uniref:hypothetical protein n=1 Tax=Coleofasciculus sp. E1-EBD-02 TaxID=3068481 RepID=UPI0032FAE211
MNAKRSKSEASPAPWKSIGLALAPTYIGDNFIMLYQDRLKPWIVVNLLPNFQRVVMGRYRRWSDADGHVRILRQLIPTARLTIIFDPID